MPTPVTVRPITGIKDGPTARSIIVTDQETGRDICLPRKVIDFHTGRVIIPVWLAREIFNAKRSG